MLQHLPLGQFESQQHPPANLNGVLDGLESRGKGSPLFVAKVGVSGPGSQHQVVMPDPGPAEQRHQPGSSVNRGDLVHQHLGIRLFAQNRADGLGDLRRGQHGQRHLVKQRLKRVMVAAVDDGHFHRQFRQSLGGMEAAKPSADDDHARPCGCLIQDFVCLTQNAPSCLS